MTLIDDGRVLDQAAQAAPAAYLPAVRVEAGWAVCDREVWRLVVAEPELLGDGDDEDGGRVELLLAPLDVDQAEPDHLVLPRGRRIWVTALGMREVVDRLRAGARGLA